MGTARQNAANRANAAKSCGPRTPEGKARSARNAVTHGLLARTRSLPPAEQEEFRVLLEALRDALRPANVLEDMQLHDIAMGTVGKWRAFQAECEAVGSPVAEHGEDGVTLVAAFVRNAVPLHLLLRYAARADRMVARAISQLRTLQADRRLREDGTEADALLEVPAAVDDQMAMPASPLAAQDQSDERGLFEIAEVAPEALKIELADAVQVGVFCEGEPQLEHGPDTAPTGSAVM
jgi:hypothetical protein